VRRNFLIFGGGLLAVLLAAGGWFLFQFRVSALRSPGRTETALANGALRWYVSREARGPLPAAPAFTLSNVSAGQSLFTDECGLCHGPTGTLPTEMGQSLYPPAPVLDSARVQQWSNRDLFWIIQHGIRNTGMPGFARTYTNRDIWQLIEYIRTLGGASPGPGLGD
jgi:mono/diheme cytochrome c family protein